MDNATSLVTTRRFADILGKSVSLMAAAGGKAGLTASSRLPPTIVKDVASLRSLTEFSMHFETFHHARCSFPYESVPR